MSACIYTSSVFFFLLQLAVSLAASKHAVISTHTKWVTASVAISAEFHTTKRVAPKRVTPCKWVCGSLHTLLAKRVHIKARSRTPCRFLSKYMTKSAMTIKLNILHNICIKTIFIGLTCRKRKETRHVKKKRKNQLTAHPYIYIYICTNL